MQEAIKRLRYVYTSEGADKVASDMQRVNAAHAGIAVQSEKAERATLSLDSKFASLERRYNSTLRAQQDYARLQQQVNAAVQANPALQERANSVLALAAKHFNAASAANDNLAKSTGLARHEMVNLSRQVQDIGVSLASGQSPFTVLVQQGTQVADIFGNSQGTIRGFGAQIASLITPMRALALGITAVGAVAIAAAFSWKNFALALDDTARQAGITSSEMAKLQAAASFKGIGNDDFAKAMGVFSQNVYEAKNNMGGLAEVFRANGGVVPKDFEASLLRVADLVKGASSDIQKQAVLRQAGLPSDMAWVRLMSQGAEGIKKAKEEAVAFGGAANDNLVAKAREFDDAWNRITTNFGLRWRSALLDVVNFFENLSDRATAALMKIPGIGKNVPTNLLKQAMENSLLQDNSGRGLRGRQDFSEFYDATGAARSSGARGTVDPNVLKQQLALEQQRIGILGQLATVQDQVRSKEIEITLARLNGVKVSKEQEQAILALARANADGTLAIRAMADGFRIEAETVNMSVGAATAYRIEQEKVLEAKRLGISVSAQTAEAWHREAQAAGEAAQALEKARINSQIKFDRQTAFLSPDDVRIAQQLRGLYGDDVPKALASSEAAAMRTNKALSDGFKFAIDAAQEFGQTLLQGFMDGKNGADALLDALNGLKKGLLNSGMKDLFSFDPAQMALGAVKIGAAFVVDIFTDGAEARKKEEKALEDAKAAWAGMKREMDDFIQSSKGFDLSPIVDQVGTLIDSFIKLSSAASAAKDFAAVDQLNDAGGRALRRIIEDYIGLNDGLSESSKAMGQARADADGMRDALARAGLAMQDASYWADKGLANTLARIRKDFDLSILERNESATGKSYISDFRRTVEELNQALVDANAMGRGAGDIGVAFANSLQAIIDNAQVAGPAFDELIGMFPAFAGQLHAFTTEVEDAAKALAAAAERAASLNDRLFAAGNDPSTLSGALAAFDRKAQQEREAEAAAGGQNLALLEQVLAAERTNIFTSFADKMIDEERRIADERLRQMQTIQQYLDSLRGGANSTLSPSDRLTAAGDIYQRSLADFRAGTIDAGSLTTAAENYRTAGRSFYGSTTGYQDIFSRIQQDLAALLTSASATSSLGGASSITPISSGVTTAAVTTSPAANTNALLEAIRAELAAVKAELVATKTELKQAQADVAIAIASVHEDEGPNIKRAADATVDLKNAVATASALGPARAA